MFTFLVKTRETNFTHNKDIQKYTSQIHYKICTNMHFNICIKHVYFYFRVHLIIQEYTPSSLLMCYLRSFLLSVNWEYIQWLLLPLPNVAQDTTHITHTLHILFTICTNTHSVLLHFTMYTFFSLLTFSPSVILIHPTFCSVSNLASLFSV